MSTPISLTRLIRRFWRRISLTWALVLAEGVTMVAFPMVIGWAVDDLLEKSFAGVLQLAGLCALLLVFGAFRRVYDTRAYAKIYRLVADELVEREQERGSSVSRISARTGLFTEFTEFLEESVPGIIEEFIGLIGTLAIIAFIDLRVFAGCLGAVAVTALIYRLSEGRIFALTRDGNDELERHVDVLAAGERAGIRGHFRKLMRFRIKLSDLETLNFSLIWIVLAAVLVFTVVTVTSSGAASFGQIISAVMYVFGFAESVMAFPLYYQQLIRLQEIAGRLAEPNAA